MCAVCLKHRKDSEFIGHIRCVCPIQCRNKSLQKKIENGVNDYWNITSYEEVIINQIPFQSYMLPLKNEFVLNVCALVFILHPTWETIKEAYLNILADGNYCSTDCLQFSVVY